jgi:hypothetical protein
MSKILELVKEYIGASCAADHGACSSLCVEKAEQALKNEVQSVEAIHSVPIGWKVERDGEFIIKVTAPDSNYWCYAKGYSTQHQMGAFMFEYFDAQLKEQGK